MKLFASCPPRWVTSLGRIAGRICCRPKSDSWYRSVHLPSFSSFLERGHSVCVSRSKSDNRVFTSLASSFCIACRCGASGNWGLDMIWAFRLGWLCCDLPFSSFRSAAIQAYYWPLNGSGKIAAQCHNYRYHPVSDHYDNIISLWMRRQLFSTNSNKWSRNWRV
jgi:hypothetical protein